MLVIVGAVVVINGIIFTCFPDATRPKAPVLGAPADPPGWFVGSVWTLLFALMAASRWQLVKSGRPRADFDAALVTGLIVSCALYPFYTLGLRSAAIGFAGNVATLAFALYVAAQIRRSSARAAGLTVPVVAWLAFACVLTFRMLKASA